MKTKELQAELLEALVRGAKLMLEEKAKELSRPAPYLTYDEVMDLMRERSANLAAGLAPRTLRDETVDAFAKDETDRWHELLFEDLEG